MTTLTTELLWKAWPLGYVPIRGVATMGGETLQRNSEDWLYFQDFEMGNVGVGRSQWGGCEAGKWIDKGLLLPVVDPSDTATWACLLRDLAEAADSTGYVKALTYGGSLWWGGIGFGGEWWWELNTILWGETMFTQRYPFTIDTDDPALALVRARIQLRRETDHG